MATRNDTGVFNSRNYIHEYTRSLQSPVEPSLPKASGITGVCEILLNIMGEENYLAWLDTTPDDNEGFDRAAIQKLKEVTIGRAA